MVKTKHLPGDVAVWALILAELTVFGILFIVFVIVAKNNPQMFVSGKQTLHKLSGFIETIALISSSFFVAFAIRLLRLNRYRQAGFFVGIAILFALIYLWLKVVEYHMLFQQGYDIDSNVFYTLYFLLTGFHWLHVVVGLIVLLYMMKQSFANNFQKQNIRLAESGASYWHMVDIVWIILFPLVYVLP